MTHATVVEVFAMGMATAWVIAVWFYFFTVVARLALMFARAELFPDRTREGDPDG